MMAEDHKRIKTNMGSMAPEKFWESSCKRVNIYQYMFNTLQRNNGNGTFSELGTIRRSNKYRLELGSLIC